MDEISKLAGLLAEIRATASRPPLVSRNAVSVEAILSRLAIIAKCEASLTKTIEPETAAITQLEDGTSKD
jgi:hypothetical protein